MFALVPGSRIFHEDAGGYESVGRLIAAGWRGQAPPYEFISGIDQNTGYFYVTAAVYWLLGPWPSAPSYLNALLGSVTVFLVYLLARDLFHRVVARRAALLTAVIPSMVLWSSIAIKDAPVTFLIVLCLVSCVHLKRKFTAWAFVGTVVPIIAILPMRFYMIYFLGMAIAGSFLFTRGGRFISAVPKQVLVIGGAVVLLMLVGLGGRAAQGADYLSLEQVSHFRRGMASTASSGFAENVDISTPTGALTFLPVGLSVLLLAPFPWQFTSLRASFAAPEMVIWWLLIPSLIRGTIFTARHRFADASPIFLFALTLTLAYSLTHGNVGSGFRQRAQIFVFFFIFAAAGQYVQRCRRSHIDPQELLTSPNPITPGRA
jgi:4-amino-4-deoxy-L-arabinose transferase-like glycosyltransferase